MAAFAGSLSPVHAGPPPDALPSGGQVVSGSAEIHQRGATLNVHQRSREAILDWHSYNIGAKAQVNYRQPDGSSVALNRVTSSEASVIEGKLTANGQVFLINPNGVLFGKSARIEVGGIVASTLGIRNEDFRNGRYKFAREGAGGEIVNRGSIKARDGGYAVLLAPTVKNEGLIQARLGTVAMAAGDGATLELDEGRLIKLQVDPATVDTLVANKRLIRARDGTVIMTSSAADELHGAVINNSGVIEATGIKAEGGVIRLTGADDISNTGTLNVSGKTRGGDVEIAAGPVPAAPVAVGDEPGLTTVSGVIKANASRGVGGHIAVTGGDTLHVAGAVVQATGSNGGGAIHLGGGRQGLPLEGSRNVRQLVVDKDSRMDASATVLGNGGNIVHWADQATDFRGRAVARGGAQGGDGGFVEVSAHGRNFLFRGEVDTRAPHGATGDLLLDPEDVSIVARYSGGLDVPAWKPDRLTYAPSPGAGTGEILASDLVAQLGLTNVTVTTTNAGASGGAHGNITVAAPVLSTSPNALSLNADHDIRVNAPLSVAGDLSLAAGGSIQQSVNGAIAMTGSGHTGTFSASGTDGAIQLGAAANRFGSNAITIEFLGAGAHDVAFRDAFAAEASPVPVSMGGGALRDYTATFDAADITDFDGRYIPLGVSGNLHFAARSLAISKAGLDLGNDGPAARHSTLGAMGGDLVVAGNIVDSSGGSSALTLQASRDVVVGDDVSIDTSTSGAASAISLQAGRDIALGSGVTLRSMGRDIVLAADTDHGGGGQITASDRLRIFSGGGNITLGGGDAAGSGYAQGYEDFARNSHGSGIRLGDDASKDKAQAVLIDSRADSGDLYSPGGNIALRGQSAASGTPRPKHDRWGIGFNRWGVGFVGQFQVTSGQGSIVLDGKALNGTDADGLDNGILLGGWGITHVSSLVSANNTADAIRLSGDASATVMRPNGASYGNAGIGIYDDVSIAAIGSGGGVSLRGKGGAGAPGVSLGNFFTLHEVLANGGPLRIDGGSGGIHSMAPVTLGYSRASGAAVASSASDLTLIGDTFSLAAGSAIQSSGKLALQPGTPGMAVSLGRGTWGVKTDLFNGASRIFQDGFSSILLGGNATGKLSVDERFATTDPLTVLSGGTITINPGGSLSSPGELVVAGTNFTNLGGPKALQAGSSDRWLVYSNSPVGDVFGGLRSGNRAIWGESYAPQAVAEAGHRFVFGTPGAVTITTLNASKTYGDRLDLSGNYTLSGLPVSGLSAYGGAYLDAQPADIWRGTLAVDSTGVSARTAVGSYAISASGAIAHKGYEVAYSNSGQLAVRPRALTLTAPEVSKVYDGGLGYLLSPAELAALSAGLVEGDTLSSASLAYADKNAGRGKAVDWAGFTLNDGNNGANYNVTLAGNTDSSITPAQLLISADNQSRRAHRANPPLTASFQGLVGGDTPDDILNLALRTSAKPSSAPGVYPIIAQGAVNPNYLITYRNGRLQVLPGAPSGPDNIKAPDAGTAVNDGGKRGVNTGLSASGTRAGILGQLIKIAEADTEVPTVPDGGLTVARLELGAEDVPAIPQTVLEGNTVKSEAPPPPAAPPTARRTAALAPASKDGVGEKGRNNENNGEAGDCVAAVPAPSDNRCGSVAETMIDFDDDDEDVLMESNLGPMAEPKDYVSGELEEIILYYFILL